MSQGGPISASVLATAAGLTRGAMTTALDRIEAAGYARRVWDQEDRRTVRVEITDAARKEIDRLYGPLAQEGLNFLQKYTTGELAAICALSRGRAGAPARARAEDPPAQCGLGHIIQTDERAPLTAPDRPADDGSYR